ncbi:MAG: 6-bladed beta-propeller [Bacteroidales bacterium]|nr:6-bladed beta-propeller [Bacteroidales bacterium]
MKKFLNILMLLLIASCNNSQQQKQETKFDKETNAEFIYCEDFFSNLDSPSNENFDNILDTLKVIKLETTEASLLGYVVNIKFSNNYIYISDINNQFMIFDLNGNYIKSLKKGNGPGEVNYPGNFIFNNYTNELIIFDNNQIKKYTETGEYITSLEMNDFLVDFAALDNGYVLYIAEINNNYKYKAKINFTDFDFNIKKSITLDGEYPIMFSKSFYKSNDNELFMSRFYDYNVYSIKDTTLQIKYKYQLGKYEYIYDGHILTVENKYKDNVTDKFITNGIYLDCNNYQYFSFKNDERIGYILRNKQTGKMINPFSYNDEVSKYSFVLNCIYSSTVYNNYMISLFIPEYFNYFKSAKKLSPDNKISQEDINKIQSLKEDDNPLIFLFKLK